MTSKPPTNDLTITKLNRFSERWINWFAEVWRATSGQVPIQLDIYTVATLPLNPVDGLTIFVSDDSGGPTTAFSSGGVWYSSQGVLVA